MSLSEGSINIRGLEANKVEREALNELKKVAARQTVFDKMNDEDNIQDWSGGNFDDAYQMGIEDGKIFMARSVLEVMREVYSFKGKPIK